MSTHYEVIIMTPGYNMEARYVMSLLATVKELDKAGITWAFSNAGMSDVAIARENTVLGRTMFGVNSNYAKPLDGQSTYDKLFLVDSDIYWEVDDFFRLYSSNYDLVSGVYLQSDGETTTLLKATEDTNSPTNIGLRAIRRVELFSSLSAFEVDGAGLGFMCVRSGVFEAVERPWFEHRSVTKPISDTEFVVEMLSEDISFIRKVKEAGFKVYADPAVKVGHVKKTNVHWY